MNDPVILKSPTRVMSRQTDSTRNGQAIRHHDGLANPVKDRRLRGVSQSVSFRYG